MIVAYTSVGGSQEVHIDAFILEFLALPSFLFVQVVAIAAIMLVFDIFAPSSGDLNDITLDHVKMNIAVVGSTNLTTNLPLTAQGLDCMKVDNCKLQKFLSSTRSTLPAQKERLEVMRLVNVKHQDLAVAL